MMRTNKKGQYFSFDAIVATIILVLAITTLITYWFGVQSVVDAKSTYLYSNSVRIADNLMSPGVPSGWPSQVDLADTTTLSSVNQLGLTNGFTNDLNESKVVLLQKMASDRQFYPLLKKMLHMDGFGEEVYILVRQTNYNEPTVDPLDPDQNDVEFAMGCRYPNGNENEVAIAHRGGAFVFENLPGSTQRKAKPVQVLVAVWRQDQKNPVICFPS